MEKVYDYLTANYETVNQYLFTIGVEQEAITLVKKRLVGRDSVMVV
ncbi:hypothetical protein [Oceanobacillus halophilus]|nr:hypothetical protein [Oceanobacillus halophilus]